MKFAHILLKKQVCSGLYYEEPFGTDLFWCSSCSSCLRGLYFVFLMVGLCTASAFAQRATGAITGRVVADDGQPVRHATISISSMGGGGRLTVISDEDGNFQAEGLDSVPYAISATAPGLLIVPNKQRE